MPGFKASKDRLNLLLGVSEAQDLKLKPVLNYHSENSGALKNYAKSILFFFFFAKSFLPVRYKAQMTTHLLTTWITKYFKPTAKIYCSKKKNFPFHDIAAH